MFDVKKYECAKLKAEQFYLAMKDHWNAEDYKKDTELDNAIRAYGNIWDEAKYINDIFDYINKYRQEYEAISK